MSDVVNDARRRDIFQPVFGKALCLCHQLQLAYRTRKGPVVRLACPILVGTSTSRMGARLFHIV